LEEVIDNYLNAIGGTEHLNQIETKIEESVFIKYAPLKAYDFNFIPNDTLNVIYKFKRPNKIYYSSHRNTDLFEGILCHNGNYFWTRPSKTGNFSIQSKEEGDAFVQHSFIGLFEVLQEEDTEIEYLGIEELQGEKYNILKIKRKGWYRYHKYYFDMDTRLLYGVTVIDANAIRYTIYKDYKKVDNIYSPFVVDAYDDKWNLTSRATYTNIQLNVPIDDKEFQIPGKE
jgi:hypothetical protein